MSASIQTDEDWQQLVAWWRRVSARIDTRALRKSLLAAMFTFVALVYIGQLAAAGVLGPVTMPGMTLGGTIITLGLAALAGGTYLWRTGIRRSVEITVVAAVVAHVLATLCLPFLYSSDVGEILDDELWLWMILVYGTFAVVLAIGYVGACLLFHGWRASYRTRLIVAGLIVIAAVVFELNRGRL